MGIKSINLKIKIRSHEKKVVFFIAFLSFVFGLQYVNLLIKEKDLNGLMLMNIEALASNGGEGSVTMDDYSEIPLICGTCNVEVPGCIWCSADDGCKCTVPIHKCTK